MTENTIYVGRPTKWGNRFDWQIIQATAGVSGDEAKRRATALYAEEVAADRQTGFTHGQARRELAGKNLACFCRLCPEHRDGKPLNVRCEACAPCHVDVLGELLCE
jgi:hypothetical protein